MQLSFVSSVAWRNWENCTQSSRFNLYDMLNYSCILIGSRLSSIGAQTLNLLSFLYHGKEKGSMLPCVWSVVDHRGRQNVETTSVTHSIMHLSSASPRGGTPSWRGFPEGGPRADVWEYVDLTGTLQQISALVVGGNVKFLNALLSGRMWGVRFCLTERRLGTIDVGISNFKIPLCIYCL